MRKKRLSKPTVARLVRSQYHHVFKERFGLRQVLVLSETWAVDGGFVTEDNGVAGPWCRTILRSQYASANLWDLLGRSHFRVDAQRI